MTVLVYVGLGAVLFMFQKHYLFMPDHTDFLQCDELEGAERVTYGTTRAYLTARSPERIVVLYHGNAGRACDRSFMEPTFAGDSYSTLFVEYTGYAETGRDPGMRAILANVADTIRFLEVRGYREVMVVGESVGTGPAAYHARAAPVSGLVLMAAYTELASVARAHLPVYPVRLLLRHNFTPDLWLAEYRGPVSIIVAEHDEIVPPELGRELYERIPSSEKQFHIVPNARHNTMYELPEFYSTLSASLSSLTE